MFRHHRILIACVSLTLAGVGAAAHADTAGDIFFDEIRRQEQRNEEQRRHEPKPDVRLQPEAAPPAAEALPRETVCFTIERIVLDGLPADRFEWAQPLADRYVGQCIGAEGVTVIVKTLQAGFLARGFITTRVYVPKQNLIDATLTLKIVPGVIREIRFADKEGRGSWHTAFPTRPGEMLNLRDLEQGLEQMKRMPSQDIDMDILPGAQPGESDIVIKRRAEKAWRAILSADNSGSKHTGEWQGSATLAWDDPFGIDDLFNISWNNDLDRNDHSGGTRGDSVYYSFPYGYWTYSLSASEYRYFQTISGVTQDFKTSGTMDQYNLRVQRVLFRTAVSKTAAQFQVTRLRGRSFIEDVELDVQRRDVTAAELALQHHRFLGRSVLDLSLAYRRGVPWFGAQDDPGAGSPGSPTTRFTMETLDASLNVPFSLFDADARYVLAVRGQTTKDTLFGTDFFAIGNRYTVRGFDGEQTLAAERGLLTRNELGLSLGSSGQELYAGLDYGEVSGPSASVLSGRHLAGSVLGLRGAYKKVFQYDMSAGWALSKPDQFDTRRPVYTLQASYQF
jgi:hemolysin activation/secretion protein